MVNTCKHKLWSIIQSIRAISPHPCGRRDLEDFIMTNNNQTDIFSIFNLVDDHAVAQKEVEDAKKAEEAAERAKRVEEVKQQVAANPATTEKSKPAEKKVEKETFTPNEETTIRYFGESHPITSYFTPEELVEGLLVKRKDKDPERVPLDGEMLRKRMEKDFPELVKDHTDIIYIANKNLVVPIMKAKKKGICEMTLPSGGVSSLPKIPFAILRDFISLAKFYGTIELEVHADIYYSLETRTYFLDIPKQRVHSLWVEVTESSQELAERLLDAVKVMEIHSHHIIAPRPSAQDNESERVPGMHYAIVGRTRGYFPEVTLRQFISDDLGWSVKSIDDVFQSPFERLVSFSTRDIKVVSL